MLIANYSNRNLAPLVMECGGRPGPYLQNIINKAITSHYSTPSEQSAARVLHWQHISITNARGVADCIRLNPSPPPPRTPHDRQLIDSLLHGPLTLDLPEPFFPPRPPAPFIPTPPAPPPWVKRLTSAPPPLRLPAHLLSSLQDEDLQENPDSHPASPPSEPDPDPRPDPLSLLSTPDPEVQDLPANYPASFEAPYPLQDAGHSCLA